MILEFCDLACVFVFGGCSLGTGILLLFSWCKNKLCYGLLNDSAGLSISLAKILQLKIAIISQSVNPFLVKIKLLSLSFFACIFVFFWSCVLMTSLASFHTWFVLPLSSLHLSTISSFFFSHHAFDSVLMKERSMHAYYTFTYMLGLYASVGQTCR